MRNRSSFAPTCSISAALAACGALAALGCGSDPISVPSPDRATGTLVVHLTDAPFPLDSLQSVDIYVVRIEGKQAATDSADVDSTTIDDSSERGWKTLATPEIPIDLLSLQHGTVANLGAQTLAAGTWRSFRFVLDPERSSVTLKDGTFLTSSSSPGVKFPSGKKLGIKIKLDTAVTIAADSTTTLLVDFDLGSSLKMRGNDMQKGLVIKPTIKATTM